MINVIDNSIDNNFSSLESISSSFVALLIKGKFLVEPKKLETTEEVIRKALSLQMSFDTIIAQCENFVLVRV